MESRLAYSLLLLRLSVFIVMAMWTLDKFLNPEHTARVFEKFYLIANLSSSAAYIIGGLQALVILEELHLLLLVIAFISLSMCRWVITSNRVNILIELGCGDGHNSLKLSV